MPRIHGCEVACARTQETSLPASPGATPASITIASFTGEGSAAKRAASQGC